MSGTSDLNVSHLLLMRL